MLLVCVTAMTLSQAALADFKYSETSRITGGMVAGLMKFAAHFSKDVNEPTVSTIYVKGNRFRRDSSDGTVEIIDLDGRRIIRIDGQKRTYSVMTFEQIRQAAEMARQQMQQKMEEVKNQQGSHGKVPANTQVSLAPKIDVTPTDNTREILGQATKEVKVKFDLDMQVQGTSAANGPQNASGSMTMTSDMWVASSLGGYQEVKDFYKRMAKEMDFEWRMPGLNIDPRAARGLQELQKNSSHMQGLPMVQYVSMYMGGMQGQGNTKAEQGNQPAAQPTSSASSSQPTPSEAATKALTNVLGGFGGFGRRKKKQEQQPDQASGASSASSSAAPASNPGSFMDLTSEVTSFSSEPLDSSLFDVPAGYTLIQANPEKMLGAGKQ